MQLGIYLRTARARLGPGGSSGLEKAAKLPGASKTGPSSSSVCCRRHRSSRQSKHSDSE